MNIGFAGCSFTYGSELERAEESRWSKLVSERLGANELNFAKPGSSNDEICKNVFEQVNRDQFDFFVIQVTSNIRFSLALHRKVVSIGPTQRHIDELYNLISKVCFSKYSQYDDSIWHEMTRWKLICLHHYLTNIRMKHMFVFMSDDQRSRMMSDMMTPNSFRNVSSNISLLDYCVECGYPMGPNRHPLEQGHEGIANDIILPKMKELL